MDKMRINYSRETFQERVTFIEYFFKYYKPDDWMVIAPIRISGHIHYKEVTSEQEISNYEINRLISCDVCEAENILLSLGGTSNIVVVFCPQCHAEYLRNRFSEHRYVFVSWVCRGVVPEEIYNAGVHEYDDTSFNGTEIIFRKDNVKHICIVDDKSVEKELYFGKKLSLYEGYKYGIIQDPKCYECACDNNVSDVIVKEIENESGAFVQLNTDAGKTFFSIFSSEEEYVTFEFEKCANFVKNVNVDYFLDSTKTKGVVKSIYDAVNNKFDIGLVSGYRTSNYGGTLTQMALYFVLKELGYSVLMIERPLHAQIGPDFRDTFTADLPYKQYELARNYASTEEMVELNSNCRMFMIGSDQFMNSYLYHATDEVFSLKWVYENKPKFAYAVSFGFDYIWDTEEQLGFRNLFLNRFNRFSVREEAAIDIMKDQFGVDADLVLDPVFLCDKNKYIQISEKYNNFENKPEDYIFCFILNPSKEKELMIKSISDSLGLKAVVYSDCECADKNYIRNWNLDTKTDASISEWLFMMKESSFVITDSFHGTCFSVIFEKNFVCIENTLRGKSRFDFFKCKLNLRNHIVSIGEKIDDSLEQIDYTYINNLLFIEKERCRKYIGENVDKCLSFKFANTSQDLLLKKKSIKYYRSIFELGLSKGCTVDDIIARMPNNSEIHQVQGSEGEPLRGIPCSYGVLEIYKTSNYFIKCIFFQMTMDNSEPYIFQAKIKNQKAVEWTRYITYDEYDALKHKVCELESKINDILNA